MLLLFYSVYHFQLFWSFFNIVKLTKNELVIVPHSMDSATRGETDKQQAWWHLTLVRVAGV